MKCFNWNYLVWGFWGTTDCSPGHGISKKKKVLLWVASGVLFNVYLLLCISFVHICIIICPVLVVPKILYKGIGNRGCFLWSKLYYWIIKNYALLRCSCSVTCWTWWGTNRIWQGRPLHHSLRYITIFYCPWHVECNVNSLYLLQCGVHLL